MLIATVGRCGSSFVAKCFRELGVEVDPAGFWRKEANAGLEHGPVAKLNLEIRNHFIHKHHLPTNSSEITRYAKIFGDQMKKALDGIRVVKDPRFCWSLPIWIQAGVVRRILIVQRDSVENVVRSCLKNKAGRGKDPETVYRLHGYLTWHAVNSGLPLNFITYPLFMSPGPQCDRLSKILASESGKSIDESRRMIQRLSDGRC